MNVCGCSEGGRGGFSDVKSLMLGFDAAIRVNERNVFPFRKRASATFPSPTRTQVSLCFFSLQQNNLNLGEEETPHRLLGAVI